MTIREHIQARVRAFRIPVLIAWLAVCFYEGERSHPSRRVFAAWIGVLILYSFAVYLIRCPKCGARLGTSAINANAQSCPSCATSFDKPLPE